MNFPRNILLLLVIFLGLTSCLITNDVRTIKVEIMKPGIFNIPADINSVAILNRDIFQSDTSTITYSYAMQDLKDTTIKYHDLSNVCVDALSKYLSEEGNFQKVKNFGDSLNFLLKDPRLAENRSELFEKTKSDVCIFLDYIHFDNSIIYNYEYPFSIKASLLWMIAFKNDSAGYTYNQTDTLLFDQSQYRNFRLKNQDSKQQYKNSAEYLGSFMGTKLIPSWLPVDRFYYKSKNPDMKKAEKFALQNDWIKAAEIWNREAKNKNLNISAKACYNMALACEMEGKPDTGIEWLNKFFNSSKNVSDHKFFYQQYINVLIARIREIEKLDDQLKRQ